MKLWDFYAVIYRSLRAQWPFSALLRKEKKQLTNLARLLPAVDDIVLDVGCGVGHSVDLVPGMKFVVGVDSSTSMAKKTHEKGVPVVVAEAQRLPIKHQSVLCIQAIGVSEYISDLAAFFKECVQIVRLPGYVLLTSSPVSVISFLRRFAGHKIFIRQDATVIAAARGGGFQLVAQKKLASQHAFLFGRHTRGKNAVFGATDRS